MANPAKERGQNHNFLRIGLRADCSDRLPAGLLGQLAFLEARYRGAQT